MNEFYGDHGLVEFLRRVVSSDPLESAVFTIVRIDIKYFDKGQLGGQQEAYLLLHCSFAMEVLAAMLGYFGVSWMAPKEIKPLVQRWRMLGLRHWDNIIWKLIPTTACWSN